MNHHKVNDELVLEIVKEYYAEVPVINRFYSVNNFVVGLDFQKFKKVIKINTSDTGWRLEKEHFIFKLLKSHNIHTPDIDYIDISGKKYPPYYIMESLGKHTLRDLFRTNPSMAGLLYEQMGVSFAKIHLIKFEQQGFIKNNDIKEVSFYKTSEKKFENILNKLIQLDFLSTGEVAKSEQLFSKFHTSEEAVLCHSDFGANQVIVDENNIKIKGIIDWEFASSSSSISDFAKAEMRIFCFGGNFDRFRKGYEKVRQLPKDYDEVKKAYLLPHVFGLMHYGNIFNNRCILKASKEYFDKLISN